MLLVGPEKLLIREFYPKFAIITLVLGSALGLPMAANAQYSNSISNGVEITLGAGVVDTDESNNFAFDVDFARGAITIAKTGDGAANLAGASQGPSDYLTTGTGNVTVTSIASFDTDNDDNTADVLATTNVTDDEAADDRDLPTSINFDPGVSSTFSTLPVGTYTFTETPVVAAGDPTPKLVSVTCNTSLPGSGSSFTAATTFDAGNGAVTGTNGGATVFSVLGSGANLLAADADEVVVDLASGEQVDCTFNNVIVDLEVTKTWREGACSAAADVSAISDTEAGTQTPAQTGNYTPGGQGCYVVTISNEGVSSTSGAFAFVDSLFDGSVDPDLTINSASCSAAGDAMCGAFSNNATDSTLNIALTGATTTITAGDSITISVDVNVDAGRTTDIVNVASVYDIYDPNADTASELSAQLTLVAQVTVDVSVNKTDGVLNYVPGDSLTYTINVCNYGPSDVTGATMTDQMPSGITPSAPSCSATDINTLGASAPTSSITSFPSSPASAATFTCPSSVSAGTNFDVLLGLPAGSCVTVSVPYTIDN